MNKTLKTKMIENEIDRSIIVLEKLVLAVTGDCDFEEFKDFAMSYRNGVVGGVDGYREYLDSVDVLVEEGSKGLDARKYFEKQSSEWSSYNAQTMAIEFRTHLKWNRWVQGLIDFDSLAYEVFGEEDDTDDGLDYDQYEEAHEYFEMRVRNFFSDIVNNLEYYFDFQIEDERRMNEMEEHVTKTGGLA